MKITKEMLKKLIKEEMEEAAARPVGTKMLRCTSEMTVFTDGRFNVDVEGVGAVTGRLDQDSLDELMGS